MSKLIIKYVRIVDNTSLESYLVQGDVYGVVEETTGDLFDFYRLDVDTPYQDGLWVNKSRCCDMDSGYPFSGVELKHTIDLPSMLKQTVENIIEIPFPSDTSHGVDLYRVQYISPLDKGCYELTMGWMEKVKLTEEIYPRARMMAQWKAVRNK